MNCSFFWVSFVRFSSLFNNKILTKRQYTLQYYNHIFTYLGLVCKWIIEQKKLKSNTINKAYVDLSVHFL